MGCDPSSSSSLGAEGRKLQRAVLAFVLHEHPIGLTIVELADKLFDDLDEVLAGAPLACAVRDLAMGGLLRSRGHLLLPTRAALHIKQLELCQWPSFD